jgi:hypothetical protein
VITPALVAWAITKWGDDEWSAEVVLGWSEDGEPLVFDQDTNRLALAGDAAGGTLWNVVPDAAWESATDRIRAAIAAAKGWADA